MVSVWAAKALPGQAASGCRECQSGQIGIPPTEMIQREPHLPRFMAGGQGNPLGARALYLGKSLYRIHGTNQPSTIGAFVSSGCIRLTNDDIIDLYARVHVGARVVVLRGQPSPSAAVSGINNSHVETRPFPLIESVSFPLRKCHYTGRSRGLSLIRALRSMPQSRGWPACRRSSLQLHSSSVKKPD